MLDLDEYGCASGTSDISRPKCVRHMHEHTTSFAYNSRNQLTSKTRPGLKPEEFGRNALGDLLSVTTPEGNKTDYAYDANGVPKQITDPAENVWKIELNAMERPTAYVDPLGKETKVEYDGNLNPVKITDRHGKATTYAYDLANQLEEVVRPEGGDWEFPESDGDAWSDLFCEKTYYDSYVEYSGPMCEESGSSPDPEEPPTFVPGVDPPQHPVPVEPSRLAPRIPWVPRPTPFPIP